MVCLVIVFILSLSPFYAPKWRIVAQLKDPVPAARPTREGFVYPDMHLRAVLSAPPLKPRLIVPLFSVVIMVHL
jgi:hypothetical protein